MEVSRTERLDASPQEVFGILADWPGHPRWQETVESAEIDGVLKAGARVVEVRRGYGQRLTFDLAIVEYEPPRRIRAAGRSRGAVHLEATELFEAEPDGAGTQVRLAIEYELPLILRPLSHGVASEIGAHLERSLAALARLLQQPASSR